MSRTGHPTGHSGKNSLDSSLDAAGKPLIVVHGARAKLVHWTAVAGFIVALTALGWSMLHGFEQALADQAKQTAALMQQTHDLEELLKTQHEDIRELRVELRAGVRK